MHAGVFTFQGCFSICIIIFRALSAEPRLFKEKPCFLEAPKPGKCLVMVIGLASPSGANTQMTMTVGPAKTYTLRGTPWTYAIKIRGLWPTNRQLDPASGEPRACKGNRWPRKGNRVHKTCLVAPAPLTVIIGGNASLFTKCLFTIWCPLTPLPKTAKWWISSWISLKRPSNRIASTQPK